MILLSFFSRVPIPGWCWSICPFSLIGAVAAIALISGGLSVGPWSVLVTVFGVSARNAKILFLAHYEPICRGQGAPGTWTPSCAGRRNGWCRSDDGGVTAGPMRLAIGLHQKKKKKKKARAGDRRTYGGDGGWASYQFDLSQIWCAAGPGERFRGRNGGPS